MGSAQNRPGATTKSDSSMITARAPAASLIDMRVRRSRPSTMRPCTPEPGDIAPGPEGLYPSVADPDRAPVETAPAEPPEPPLRQPEAPPPQPEAPPQLEALPPQPEAPPHRPRPAPQKRNDIVAYWSQLKDGRHFPSWSDLDSKLIADCWPNSLLLSCGADAQRLTLESLFMEALRDENRSGGGNRGKGIDFTPMLTDWLLSLGREAERFGKPMQDTDALPSVSGEVRYRVIALPLSDDQKRIDHVLCHVDRA